MNERMNTDLTTDFTSTNPSLVSGQWRRPGAEFGGGGKIFRGTRFLNDFFGFF